MTPRQPAIRLRPVALPSASMNGHGPALPGGPGRSPSQPRQPGMTEAVLQDLRERLRDAVRAETQNLGVDPTSNTHEYRDVLLRLVRETLAAYVREQGPTVLGGLGMDQAIQHVFSEVYGFSVLDPLLADPEVTEIMVVGPEKVAIEVGGKTTLAPVTFRNEQHLVDVIARIARFCGREINEAQPLLDARLPDGSRVHASLKVVCPTGPELTIRKFRAQLSLERLIAFGSLDEALADLLKQLVVGRANILVSGGTGSGKTTMLNILSEFIPDHERIITIEDSRELQIRQWHWVAMEARPANIEGRGEITIRELVRNSLRMRPDRVVVGEVRAGEAFDLLQAMNTGHDGTMGTIHANSAADCIKRMESLVLMAGMDLPYAAIRQQIASAIDAIVQIKRLRDGSRKVVEVAEIGEEQAPDGSPLAVAKPVVRFVEDGEVHGKIQGHWEPTGHIPRRLIEKCQLHGVRLPDWVTKGGEQG
ncbi:CpaF family protein [Thermaerobacter litoralis]